MDDVAAVAFSAVQWSKAAEKMLRIIEGAGDREISIFRDFVQSGEAVLTAALVDNVERGFVVWRLDQEADGMCLCICAAAILPDRKNDMTQAMHDYFCMIAPKVGARSLRCFTRREGLRQKLEKLGAKSRYELEKVF